LKRKGTLIKEKKGGGIREYLRIKAFAGPNTSFVLSKMWEEGESLSLEKQVTMPENDGPYCRAKKNKKGECFSGPGLIVN